MCDTGLTFLRHAAPADGSCFFASVAIILGDGDGAIARWPSVLHGCMMREWSKYMSDGRSELRSVFEQEVRPGPIEMTTEFVRFVSAGGLIPEDLDQYNSLVAAGEASYSIPADDIEELRRRVRTNGWADFVSIRSFLRGIEFSIGLLIFDDTTSSGLVMFPSEWFKDKSAYGMIMRHSDHYDAIEARRGESDRPGGLLVSRGDILDLAYREWNMRL